MMKPWSSRGERRLALLALGATLAIVIGYTSCETKTNRTPDGAVDPSEEVVSAFRDHKSGLMVESAGEVVRLLEDDTNPPRHQRFIVRIGEDHTVLISHNIDVAPRAEVAVGQRVRFRGQYEWNDRGGVVHWTHHDPSGRRPGGWIESGGKRFR